VGLYPPMFSRLRWLVLVIFFLAMFISARKAAAGEAYDLAISGEGRVGLFSAVKLKLSNPRARVAIFEKRPLDRGSRPGTRTYTQESIDEFRRLGVPSDKFMTIRERLVTRADGSSHKLQPPRKTSGYQPYDLSVLLEGAVATDAAGSLEAELRARAIKLGVEIFYETEVIKADSVRGGVEFTVQSKEGSRVVRSHFGILADGTSGLGARLANTTVIGSIPLLAMETSVRGDGKYRVVESPDPSAPDGFTLATSMGSDSGTSLLAETPAWLETRSGEEKVNWFNGQAKRAGIDPKTFLVDAAGKAMMPWALSAVLSRGATGRGHLFFTGDSSGTIPVLINSGVNKGILQAASSLSVVSDLLNHPTSVEAEDIALATHHTRATQAQATLVFAIQKELRSRLRPPTQGSGAQIASAERTLRSTLGKEPAHVRLPLVPPTAAAVHRVAQFHR
jgi:hypothetical protein